MASRGQGRRGRPWGTGQAPPVFDQQTFAEAIAQAGNLQRFRAYHPPTFTGGGDPMVTDHWFM